MCFLRHSWLRCKRSGVSSAVLVFPCCLMGEAIACFFCHAVAAPATCCFCLSSGAVLSLLQGFPQFVLPNCADFWDGTNISPFNRERQSVVLEMSKQWQQEGMTVHAFAYDPVSIKVCGG
jgi:hypothetical protein